MKSLLTLALSLTIFAFAAGARNLESGYVAQDNEILYGSWVNVDAKTAPHRTIRKPDGTFEIWMKATSQVPTYRGRYLITGKWEDAEGNTWYRWHWVGNWDEEGYTLGKVSDSGKTIETLKALEKYPAPADLQDVSGAERAIRYRKYTRE